ncbi:MAG: hypothetical protein JW854_16970 [Actinobacteria bacterium]|nr:hypothetical protein [Actinomycetota bacterium]
MKKIKVCASCGVPRELSVDSHWGNDGTISSLSTPGQRSLLYETDGLNGLLRNIEALVGQSVNRIVAEGKRKESLDFLEDYFSGVRGMLARSIGRRRVYMTIASLAAIFGYGHFELREIKRGAYVKVYGRNMYCAPLLTGDLMAAFNVIEGLPASVHVEEKDGGQIITVRQGEEPDEELSARLEPVMIAPKPGNIHFDTCASCGAPTGLISCDFDFEEGIITDTKTGRRMAFLTLDQIDAALRELEVELGEDIAAVILQAQRDYIKNNLEAEEMGKGYQYLRYFLALRGLGNLVKYDIDDAGMEALIENARPPLLVAGIMHGIFELLSALEGKVEYRTMGDGTLGVKVTAA